MTVYINKPTKEELTKKGFTNDLKFQKTKQLNHY